MPLTEAQPHTVAHHHQLLDAVLLPTAAPLLPCRHPAFRSPATDSAEMGVIWPDDDGGSGSIERPMATVICLCVADNDMSTGRVAGRAVIGRAALGPR